MKKKRMIGLTVVAALAIGFAAAHNLRADSDYDFTLVNCTGYSIDEVYVSAGGKNRWGSDIMGKGTLPHNHYVEINFHPDASAPRWDLKIKWTPIDGEEYPAVVWKSLDLAKIYQINLYYNKSTEATTAKFKDKVDHSCN